MYIEQLYTNCLAEAAYYIESEGIAAIIDPIRDTEIYIKKAKERGATIKYVFETHFHADFVSGHIDLANNTGATIVFGPLAETAYKIYSAKDNEEFKIGKISIKVMHTPGHTPESTCYLLKDETGKDHAVFTGDTLFVGDVGRPDLLDGKMSREELAGMLYESLNNKIKPLADDIIVYPAHGPGSACGKNIGKETWSTIGNQKQFNYALQPMDKASFVNSVCAGLSEPPSYFFEDARINKTGYDPLERVVENGMQGLSASDLVQLMKKGVTVLDTRTPDEFEKGFIPGSLNIGLNGQYAIWAGTLLKLDDPLVIIADEGKEEESIIRLARVGFSNITGHLKGAVKAWLAAGYQLDTVRSITPEQFSEIIKSGIKIIDVRKIGEFSTAHVEGASNINLPDLETKTISLDKNEEYLVHCAGGYRSMIGCSILKNLGFKNVVNVYGGFAKIKDTGVPVVAETAAV